MDEFFAQAYNINSFTGSSGCKCCVLVGRDS